MQHNNTARGYTIAGLFTLSVRLVAGWTYFSAFWRRLVLENKLNPEAPGYIGEKFNHFMPNALGIKPMIEYLVSNPEILWWFMMVFTIIEGIVGLFFMLGFFTRAMAIGVFALAMGILLGAGWLGTTCLDEWQIGILGIAAGFTIFLSGGGRTSLDFILRKNYVTKRWTGWLGSDPLPLSEKALYKTGITGAAFIFALSLFTNQYFHGGVWGTLHNMSVKPHVEISEAKLGTALSFTIFRTQGADVYGSFLIGITLKDKAGKDVFKKDQQDLSVLPEETIANDYVAKVKPGKHSLILPLGAKAKLTFNDVTIGNIPEGSYILELTDISGTVWTASVRK